MTGMGSMIYKMGCELVRMYVSAVARHTQSAQILLLLALKPFMDLSLTSLHKAFSNLPEWV